MISSKAHKRVVDTWIAMWRTTANMHLDAVERMWEAVEISDAMARRLYDSERALKRAEIKLAALERVIRHARKISSSPSALVRVSQLEEVLGMINEEVDGDKGSADRG